MRRSTLLAMSVAVLSACGGTTSPTPGDAAALRDAQPGAPDAAVVASDGGEATDARVDDNTDAAFAAPDAETLVADTGLEPGADAGPEEVDGGEADGSLPGEPDGGPAPLPSITVRRHIQLPHYLWHMACVDGELYSGTYADPNVFYLVNLQGDEFHLTIDNDGESTRPYNLGGELFVTSEGGAVFSNGDVHSNLGGHYVLSATHFAGQNLVSRSPRSDDSAVQLWACTHAGCALSRTVGGIRVYHMVPYRGELYLLGRNPKGAAGGYNVGNAMVYRDGVGVVLSESTNGIAVRGTVFDDRLFVGIANPARIRSYDGTSWFDEHSFPGFHHLGDLIEFRDHLFAVVVVDGGGPEVWARSRAGTWTRLLDAAALAGYGVKTGIAVNGTDVVLNNAAGFFTVCQDRLFMNINTPDHNRVGPGFILELVAQ